MAGMYPSDASRTTPVDVRHPNTLAITHQAAARPRRYNTTPPGPIGYARTRHDPADLRHAIAALNQLGVHSANIHTDTGNTGSLPGVTDALTALPAGGALVVESFARLARSLGHLAHIVDQLDQRRVTLQVGTIAIADLTAAQLLRELVEFELQLVDGDTADAAWIDRESRRDPRGAHPSLLPVEALHLQHLFDAGLPRHDLGALFGLSRASVYRLAGRPVTPRRR